MKNILKIATCGLALAFALGTVLPGDTGSETKDNTSTQRLKPGNLGAVTNDENSLQRQKPGNLGAVTKDKDSLVTTRKPGNLG